MNALEEQKTAYSLMVKERIYRDKTLSSLFFLSNLPKSKKSTCPIDVNGERMKLNLQTGEIDYYSKREVLNSMQQSVKRTKILLSMLLEMNDFDWFCTLTFDKAKIDRTDDALVFDAYVKYINNIKKQFPLLRYICVPERHEDGCVHFHLLIGGVTTKQLGLVNSGKVCCSWAWFKNKICSREFFEKTKHEHILTDTDGLPVYNITTFPYGLTTATRIVSREKCNTYVKKYIDKAIGVSTEIFKKRFYYSANLNVPEIVTRQFGADFEKPKNLMSYFNEDPHIKTANFVNYNEKHNILQFWEDKKLKEIIDAGYIPAEELDLVLDDNEQLSF